MKDLILELRKNNIEIQLIEGKLKLKVPNNIDVTDVVLKVKKNKDELISYISNRKQDLNKQNRINCTEKREYYPLSYSQKRIYYLEQLYNSGTSYNGTRFFKVKGKLNIDHIEYVFNKLIEHHEVFRTSFFSIGGIPFQRIHKKIKLNILKYNLLDTNNSLLKEKLLKDIIYKFEKQFDLSKAPLIRIGVVEDSAEEWYLLFDINHIVSDLTTYTLLVKDFILLYNKKKLIRSRIQYKDYCLWEKEFFKSDDFSKKKYFWKNAFSKKTEELNIPIDFTRSNKINSKGNNYSFSIDEGLTTKLRRLASAEGVTIFILLLTIFKVFIYKLTGQTDICIGSPYSLRNNDDLRSMFGILLNTIVFRSNPLPGKTFNQYLAEIKHFSINAYNNHEYPFEILLEEIKFKRTRNRNPIFDILFNSQTPLEISLDDEVFKKTALEFSLEKKEIVSTPFDISMMLNFSTSEIIFNVQYRTSLFEFSTIKRFMNEYIQLMEKIIENPNGVLQNFTIFENTKKKRLKISNQL